MGFEDDFTVSLIVLLLSLGGLALVLVLLIYTAAAEQRAERKRRMVLTDADMQLLLGTVEKIASLTENQASQSSTCPRRSTLKKVAFKLKSPSGSSGSKFGAASKLISGSPAEAVYGLFHFMGVQDPFSGSSVELVEHEWRQLIASFHDSDAVVQDLQKFVKPWDPSWSAGGAPSLYEARKALIEECTMWINYVFRESCSEHTYHNGVRDKGRPNVFLDYFLRHGDAQEAELSPAHVAALRIYTTHLFKCAGPSMK